MKVDLTPSMTAEIEVKTWGKGTRDIRITLTGRLDDHEDLKRDGELLSKMVGDAYIRKAEAAGHKVIPGWRLPGLVPVWPTESAWKTLTASINKIIDDLPEVLREEAMQLQRACKPMDPENITIDEDIWSSIMGDLTWIRETAMPTYCEEDEFPLLTKLADAIDLVLKAGNDLEEDDEKRWPDYAAMDVPTLEREIRLTYKEITPPSFGVNPPCGPIQLPHLRETLRGMERILRRKREDAQEPENDSPAP